MASKKSPRPLIGITSDGTHHVDRRGDVVHSYVLDCPYVDAVRRAQGEAIILPFDASMEPHRASDWVARLDGLIVSGGGFDIDPALYKEQVHPLCGPLVPSRTLFELSLLEAAIATSTPVLGICGGMQLMVVQAGGSLYQDLSLRPNTDVHEQPESKAKPSQRVTIAPGSLLTSLVGAQSLEINSTHHQVVKTLGRLQATAWAQDGVVEAVEGPPGTFYLGVQWHPEALLSGAHARLFDGLLSAATSS